MLILMLNLLVCVFLFFTVGNFLHISLSLYTYDAALHLMAQRGLSITSSTLFDVPYVLISLLRSSISQVLRM